MSAKTEDVISCVNNYSNA